MGQSKILLPWGNTTVIEQVVTQALAANPKNVYVITGAKAQEVSKVLKSYPVTILHNDSWEQGMASSIKVGITEIKKTKAQAALITLADLPTLKAAHFNRLFAEFNQNPRAVLQSKFTNSAGVPAIFTRDTFNHLLSLEGDAGAKSLLKKTPSNQVIFDYPFEDIDTPEAYKELRKKIGTK